MLGAVFKSYQSVMYNGTWLAEKDGYSGSENGRGADEAQESWQFLPLHTSTQMHG
jgi:hypothetical protein